MVTTKRVVDPIRYESNHGLEVPSPYNSVRKSLARTRRGGLIGQHAMGITSCLVSQRMCTSHIQMVIRRARINHLICLALRVHCRYRTSAYRYRGETHRKCYPRVTGIGRGPISSAFAGSSSIISRIPGRRPLDAQCRRDSCQLLLASVV